MTELHPPQAGHGFFQVLSKVQDVLHRPLPLGFWVCGQVTFHQIQLEVKITFWRIIVCQKHGLSAFNTHTRREERGHSTLCSVIGTAHMFIQTHYCIPKTCDITDICIDGLHVF